jgi:hypothetical protein
MIIVKTGDRYPIEFTANMPLADAEVRLFATRLPSGVRLELECTKLEATGSVQHVLTGELEPGDYGVELEVTTGTVEVTFPTPQDPSEPPYELLRVLD